MPCCYCCYWCLLLLFGRFTSCKIIYYWLFCILLIWSYIFFSLLLPLINYLSTSRFSSNWLSVDSFLNANAGHKRSSDFFCSPPKTINKKSTKILLTHGLKFHLFTAIIQCSLVVMEMIDAVSKCAQLIVRKIV